MRIRKLEDDELSAATVRPSAPVRRAMEIMNESGRPFVLVEDDGVLVGVLADGDIRRYLTGGGGTDDLAGQAMNREPTTVADTTDRAAVRQIMVRRGLEYLPMMDGARVSALAVAEHLVGPSELTAVVMAGGLGRRLAPLTDHCPKPLVPVGGRPLLSHLLEHLVGEGIRHFTFAVNHLAEMIVDHYEDGDDFGCSISYVHEREQRGTGGALSLIDPDSLSDPFLVTNADVLNDIDVWDLRDAHDSSGHAATMVVRHHTVTIPYGVVETAHDGTFTGMREKPTESVVINSGIYLLSKEVLPLVPQERRYDLPVLFDDLPRAGLTGGTYLHSGRWIDVGTMAELERARAVFEDVSSS